MMNGNKMEVQMMNGEVAEVKDNMWKLCGRVQLMEKFIQKQFGDVFWEFVQEHADPGDYEDFDLTRSPTPPLAPAVTVTLIQTATKNSETMSNNSSASSTSSGGPPPPPPLIPASSLASLTGNGNSSGNSTNNSRLSGARNFLPKSFANGNGAKAKSVLRATSLSSNDSHGSSHSQHHVGSLRLNSTEENTIRKTIVTKPRSNGGESILKSSLKSSPVMVASTSLNNRAKSNPVLRVGSTPPTKPLVLKRAVPIEFLKVDEEDDHEPEDKRMMNTIENLLVYNNMPANRSVNIIRTANGIKAETDGYSAAHNGFLREMRPNPCHTRCQNRCHDIWTNKDRMDVFQVYWSIPTEDERRQWVAERIERVDMATKKTEYSNFRTCTFKYYFPHPENPRVQVCKNFFLATIDEKRSYVEKIAQEVKGISEHYSVQEIPFRRKNQHQANKGANGNSLNYGNLKQFDGYEDAVGWMTGGGMDGQEEQEYEDYVGDGEDDGMDQMEEEMV